MNSTKINSGNIKISEGLAEFYGAMIGDGCLSICNSRSRKKPIHIVLLTGHTHDEPYYRNVIRPIFYKEFGINGYLCFRKPYNMTYFRTDSRRILYFMNQLGFPIGLKGNIKIPDLIMSDDRLSLACIRGVFDTDGSIYNRYSKKYKNHVKKYNYKNIEFKMNSQNIIEQTKIILERNGIRTSNIRKNRKAYVLNIHRQKSVRQFFDLVKPSNPYHKERFLNQG